MERRAIPPRAIAAAQRIVGPARLLGGAFQVLWVAAAIAAGVIALALVVALWQAEVSAAGYAAVAPLVIVVFVPAWRLRSARSTFADLSELPQRLQSFSDDGPAFTVTRDDLANLHRGGVLAAARTVRTTVSEVTEFVSPASSVLEVASPPFWVWTAAATVATVLLVVLGVVATLYLVVG